MEIVLIDIRNKLTIVLAVCNRTKTHFDVHYNLYIQVDSILHSWQNSTK